MCRTVSNMYGRYGSARGSTVSLHVHKLIDVSRLPYRYNVMYRTSTIVQSFILTSKILTRTFSPDRSMFRKPKRNDQTMSPCVQTPSLCVCFSLRVKLTVCLCLFFRRSVFITAALFGISLLPWEASLFYHKLSVPNCSWRHAVLKPRTNYAQHVFSS